MNNTISIHTYNSLNEGNSLLITGAVHGNEHCGTIAIHKIIQEIESGIVSLIQGSVTFIPICNPKGYEQNKRFVEENLGRIFDYYDNPLSYEQQCSTIIAPLIHTCDMVLDIHSGHTPNTKFVFQDYETPLHKELSNALGFDLVVHGWPDMYPNDTGKDVCKYAYDQGKLGVLIECGQHDESQSADVAYASIKKFMQYGGVISHEIDENTKLGITQNILMKKIYYMDKPGSFSQERENGSPIKKGDIIASYDDGEQIISDIDGYIILPKQYAKTGEEWFYLAEDM